MWRCRQGWAGCALGGGLRPPPGPTEAKSSSTGPLEGAQPCSQPGCRLLASRDGGVWLCGKGQPRWSLPWLPRALQPLSWMGAGRPAMSPVHELISHPCALSLTHVSVQSHAGMHNTRAHYLASGSLHLRTPAGPRKAAVPQNCDVRESASETQLAPEAAVPQNRDVQESAPQNPSWPPEGCCPAEH